MMSIPHPQRSFSAAQLRDQVLNHLEPHLSWTTEGYRVRTHITLDVLIKAAVEGTSLEAVCEDTLGLVSSNALREQLTQALEEMTLREHEREMNAALASALPLGMRRNRVQLAMDWHDEPFYGKTPLLLSNTCRGQAKAGTTHFFRLASVCVIEGDLRLTLALTYVMPEDTTEAVVERLLHRLSQLGFHQTILMMDKGFCSGAVVRLLQRRHQKAVLACPIRGKKGGTKALCKGRRSYVTDYTFTDGTTARLVVVATCVPDKHGKRRRKWLLFVTLGLSWSPKQVYQRYRRRFGIECSYRILRQSRAFSNSRQPMLRFFLLGLALLLQNVWIFVRWFVAHIPGHGPRRLHQTMFRFHAFKCLLRRAIEYFYPPVTVIDAYQLPPQSVIH